MTNSVDQSEFYMWRTLFALAHADNIVTPEEVRYLAEGTEKAAFTDEQKAILASDMRNPQDIGEMFEKVTDQRTQARFFKHARALVHADGHYVKDEQRAMEALFRRHIKNVDIDQLIGNMDMELEEEVRPLREVRSRPQARQPFWKRLFGG
jgi:uncharacterized membrane protein YebE (DUF533 family)